MPAPEAVTIMGYVPVAVVLPTVTVMVEEPEPGAGIVLGLKLTVVPAGAPDADKAMELLNPPLTVVVIVEGACDPWATVSEVGAAERLKLGEPPLDP